VGEHSKIEWTTHTFNPWIGCQKVAPGCVHCYAEAMAKRTGQAVWGAEGTRVKTTSKYWFQPELWNRRAGCFRTFDCSRGDHADCCPQKYRPRVFVASMADVFEDWDGPVLDHLGERLSFERAQSIYDVIGDAIGSRHRAYPNRNGAFLPHQDFEFTTLSDLRIDLFSLIDRCPNLDWLLLTKRPQSIDRLLHATGGGRRDNLWLGTSISDQQTAEANVMPLLRCAPLANKIFLSIEPLLSPVDLSEIKLPHGRELDCLRGQITDDALLSVSGAPHFVDWVIVGGESGHGARPCNLGNVRSIVRQCEEAETPCFVKQLGGSPYDGDAIAAVPGSRRVFTKEELREPIPRAAAAAKLQQCLEASVVRLKDRKGGDPDEWPPELRVRQFPKQVTRPAN
jgi:protein gp37